MKNVPKKVESVINAAIVIVFIVFVAVLIQKYYFSPSRKSFEVEIGSHINLPDVGWSNYEKSLILVLQKDCIYCTRSAAFYKRLTSITKEKNVQTIAVLPGELEESQKYLNSLELSTLPIKRSELDSINVKGTPTVILTNEKGEVLRSWAGMLEPAAEMQVIESIK